MLACHNIVKKEMRMVKWKFILICFSLWRTDDQTTTTSEQVSEWVHLCVRGVCFGLCIMNAAVTCSPTTQPYIYALLRKIYTHLDLVLKRNTIKSMDGPEKWKAAKVMVSKLQQTNKQTNQCNAMHTRSSERWEEGWVNGMHTYSMCNVQCM